MEDQYSTEWWRWQLYRRIADYLHDPSEAGQAAVTALMSQYRRHHAQPSTSCYDEHEWVMDWQ